MYAVIESTAGGVVSGVLLVVEAAGYRLVLGLRATESKDYRGRG